MTFYWVILQYCSNSLIYVVLIEALLKDNKIIGPDFFTTDIRIAFVEKDEWNP
jgi:hypothetical protein